MKTQIAPSGTFRGALARDSLKTNKMFTVLYDLILFVIMPIAFEMSYVKIFQRSMSAYHVNDLDAMSRLIVYFIIQWFLGVLVRRNYLNVTLKRITLTLLILIQMKEAFYEEVLFDMVISIIMESGFILLLFFRFSNMVVVLKMVGLSWVVIAPLLFAIINGLYSVRSYGNFVLSMNKMKQTFMHRIHNCRIQYCWNRSYC
jgi:hypothetical protein